MGVLMSIGPTAGILGSAGGAPAAQTSGSETQRARQEAGAQQRQIHSQQQANSAAGIAQTDGQGHEAHERDADGRRPWEIDLGHAAGDDPPVDDSAPLNRDATGQSGTQLDLSG